jgi:signal transduction histidine kinase/CHASE1-domain containing sensor protein
MLDRKLILNKTNATILSVLGLFIWATICVQINNRVYEKFEESEKNTLRTASLVLKEKVESYIHGLQGMGGIVIAKNFTPSLKDIRDYAQFRNNFQNFPGAMGFGFIRIVKETNLKQFIQKKEAESKDFKFKQIVPHVGNHFIIEAIEPLENNNTALGLDVASESERRNAAIQAMKSATPTLTAPIELVQAKIKQGGFLFFLPVYSTKIPPATESERQKRIVGWAYSPILGKDLLKHLINSVNSNFLYHLEDITTPKTPVLILTSSNKPREIKEYNLQDIVEIGGRKWKLIVNPQNNNRKATLYFLTFMFFILGSSLFVILFNRFRKNLIKQCVMEQKYEDIESWKDSVLNGTNYSMIATKLDGTITMFNKAAENILGYQANEIIDLHTPALFHDFQEIINRSSELEEELQVSLPPGFETFVIKSKLTGKPDTNEWTYIHKSGKRTPVRLSVTAIKDNKDCVTGFLGVAEDLTEQKQLHSLIEEQKLQMMHSSKMSALGEMAGGIAHEINNPLAVIAGRTMIMKTLLDSSPQLDLKLINEQITSIDFTVQRINKIIKGLRNFSRESSKDPKEYTNIMTIVGDTLDLCQERFKKNEITISITEQADVKIWCRPVEISQILMNLMMNSYDAIVESENHRWVKIAVSTMTNKCIITLTDSGKGISPKIAERIMEPFYTTKDVGRGTGLGLSISKGIIETYQGSLVYNSKHQNTQFRIELPI